MATAPIEPLELEQKTKESTDLVQRAKAVVIIETQEQRNDAASLSMALRSMRVGLLEWWKSPCEMAHKLWKHEVARRDGMVNPVEAAMRSVDAAIVDYDERQEALRRKQEQEAAEALKKAQDEAALEEAERLYDSGEEMAAEAVLTQQAVAPAPVVIVPSTVQKVQGESTRSNWKFEVTDASLVPREYCSPNETQIGQVVRAMKSQTRIPGVRVWEEKVRSQRSSRFGHW